MHSPVAKLLVDLSEVLGRLGLRWYKALGRSDLVPLLATLLHS